MKKKTENENREFGIKMIEWKFWRKKFAMKDFLNLNMEFIN